MDVLFDDEKTKQNFSSHKELQRRWGAVGAKRILLRLQQLAAAPTLAHMRGLPGRCHELVSDRAGCLAVDVHQPYRLIFRPTSKPEGADEGLDWASVESVTIIEVIDYH